MSEVTLEANVRQKGKHSILTNLRKEGLVPGVFYKHGEANKMFSVKEIKLKPLIFSSATYIINLDFSEGNSEKCIIKDFQLDPVTNRIVHVDLLGLKEGEKITVDVGVHVVGQAAGIKDGGVLQVLLHKLQVECLPSEIPNKIDINISALKIGDAIHVKDINLDNGKILNNPGATVVAVMHPTVAKETTAADAALAEESKEPEVISKGKKTEEE